MPLSDDWRPAASLSTLKLRARILTYIRDFFARHGVLEVETPVLATAGTTDPNLHSFSAHALAPGASGRYYLHTSPEFAMKRIVAAGSGSIYQIARVFRAGEAGRWHNPEFTLLEWYRVGFDYHRLMDEVAALVTGALQGFRPLQTPEKISYRDAFRAYAGVDPHGTAAELAAAVRSHRIELTDARTADDSDFWRDVLLTHVVEPQLGRARLTFLYDYPASQAALARVRPGDPPAAERFELYLDGVELANGFQELTDPAEQRARFMRDRATRRARGLADVPHDERLLGALEHGLPECSGVALGVDRLVAAAAGVRSLRETLAFPIDGV